MKQLSTFLLLAVLLFGKLCLAQWSPISIAAGNSIDGLNFLNDDLGYVILVEQQNGNRTLGKTTDGGGTWMPIALPVVGNEFQDMYFFADGMGVALIRDLQNAVVPTRIYLTMNDGATWQDISPDTTATGMGTAQCQFLDANTGFFLTDDKFYSTVDGGLNWTTQTLSGYGMSIDFIDGNHGTVGLFDGTFNYFGGIMTTTNGGNTWNTLLLNQTGSVIGKVRQLTNAISLAAPVKFGAYSQHKFFKTTDNGVSWDTIHVPDTIPDASLSEIDFKDPMQGVISLTSFTKNYVYKTVDGGNSWVFQDSLPYFIVSDLQLTATTGYLSGAVGDCYKLTAPLAVNEPQAESLQMYPNPIGAGQRIHWTGAESFWQASILDLSGRVVHHASLGGQELEMPAIAPGIYLLRLEGEGHAEIVRLVIE